MIRILHAHHTLVSGGIATGVRYLVTGLRAPYFEHFIVISNPGEVKLAMTLTSVSVFAEPTCSWLKWGRRLLRLRRLLKELKIDVVHARGWPGVDALVAAASLPRVALVFSEHGRPQAGPRQRSVPQRLLLRWLGFHITRAFAVAPQLKEELAQNIEWTPTEVNIVPNAVDTERFRPIEHMQWRRPEDIFRLGMAGHLRSVKRPDLILEMTQQIIAKYGPNSIQIDVAGGGPLFAELRTMVQNLGLESNVVLRGHVNDMPSWYQMLNAVIVPSDYEGCSNVILEAMASGLPVIATDVGMNRSLIGNGRAGFIVPIGDAEGLAQAVMACMDDPCMVMKVGQVGRQLVMENYTLSTYYQAYSQIYSEAIQTSQNRQQSFVGVYKS